MKNITPEEAAAIALEQEIEARNTWEEVILDPDYEIFTSYPYPIRKKSNKKVIKERLLNSGYVQCNMNLNAYLKHRIIAEQWINNDDPVNKTEVDHMNHIRDDNHISNLRWVTKSQNMGNITGHGNITYTYFDEIPLDDADSIDDIIEVTQYGKHNFNNLYFYNDLFWIYNGLKYRSATIYYNKAENAVIKVYDINHKQTTINYIKFKKLHDLI